MTPPRVVIVGGGITGLSLAATLKEEARARGASVDVRVLDAGRAGGHARTIVEDGFVVEGGPNGFLDREPETLDLIRMLGLERRVVEARPEAKRRFVVRQNRLCRAPDSPPTLLTTPALSLGGKLRLLAEPFAPGPPAGVDETVFDFARRRIGREAAEMLVDAAVAGISAGDSRQLSVASQFPLMTDMEREHGSLIKAMLARRKAGKGPSTLLSFEGGLATLIDALASRMGADVIGDTGARAIERRASAWRITTVDGSSFDADRVVLAVPARAAAPMVRGFDPELAGAMTMIPYSGVQLVALAYRLEDIPRPLDGYGYLVTRPEQLATLGVVWESSLFPGRAPEGFALLRVVLGGARRPDVAAMDASAVTTLARAELQRVMRIRAEPVKTWVFGWPAAIAQYTVGHSARIAAIRARLAAHDGLDVCGTSYDGVSFNHAIAASRRMARAIAAALPARAAA